MTESQAGRCDQVSLCVCPLRGAYLFVGREIATKKGCTASQLCLAWVLAQGDDFIPIPGTKKEKYLRENLGALEVVLTKEDLAEIDAITEHIKTVGER